MNVFFSFSGSTSVWLTVSFTIERYIAVCHPMRGKFFCTENRAKTVTVIVYIFCILTTASTTFEYQLTLNDTVVCSKCQIDPNKLTSGNNTSTSNSTSSIHFISNNATLNKSKILDSSMNVFNEPDLTNALKNILINCTKNHPHIIYVYPQKLNTTHPRSIPDNAVVQTLSNMTIIHQIIEDENTLEKPPQANIVVNEIDGFNQNDTYNVTNDTVKSCCMTKFYIDVENTNLGKNEDYTTFVYWYSAMVFGIVPLVLIATFNCFLIRAVYVSQKKRSTMTRRNTQTSQVSMMWNLFWLTLL